MLNGINLKSTRGFSLIELMIVIAIIGILAAIAIPAYGDYIVRSKVTEMLGSVSTIKQSLVEYRSVKGLFASSAKSNIDFDTIGTQDPSGNAAVIKEVKVYNPTIATEVTIAVCGDDVALGLAGNTGNEAFLNVYMVGNWVNNGLKWSCEYTGSGKYIPTSCRNPYKGDKLCGDS